MSSFDTSLLHLLHRASQTAGTIFAAQQDGSGITPRQYVILAALAENEGISQTAIVERSGIDRSTLAEIVRRLAKNGLLQRRRSKQDARAYVVTLTARGRETVRDVQALARRVDKQLLAGLPQPEREQLIGSLEALSRVPLPPSATK